MAPGSTISAVSNARENRRLDGDRYLFGAGNLGKCVPWLATDMLLAWHLHAIVGLSGEAVGTALCVFMMVSAVATLGSGWLMASGRLPVRGLLWLQLGGAIITAVAFVLQFSATDLATVMAWGVVFRLGYALHDVPQKALSSILPRDDEDARRYVRLQTMLSPVVKLAITLTYLWLGRQTDLPALPALTLVAIVVVASSTAMLGIRPPPEPTTARPVVAMGFAAPTGWVRVLAVVCVAAVMLPVTRRLLIFAPDVEGWRNLGGWFLCVFCAGSILGPAMLKRLEDELGETATLTIAALAAVPSAFVQMTGEGQVAMRLAGAFAHGVAIGALLTCMWTAVARLAREDAKRTGHRRDAAIFGVAIAATHAAGALGSLVVGPLIEGIGRQEMASILLAALATSVAALAMRWLLPTSRPAKQAA